MQATLSSPHAGSASAAAQQLLRQAQPLDGRADLRPLFAEEPLALALQQQVARAGVDEHAEAAALLDQLFTSSCW
jgi:hypothetical protein